MKIGGKPHFSLCSSGFPGVSLAGSPGSPAGRTLQGEKACYRSHGKSFKSH